MSLRHSIRHFSSDSVDTGVLIKAIELAQLTPSACNRQGWRTIVITTKPIIEQVLQNQNGNRGFGQEIDKLLIVVSDLRYQQKNREVFQAFIDGGMYAESILNALFYYGIASVPLSASLTYEQEKNVRSILGKTIDDSEVLIIMVGVGNYPCEMITTTESKRHNAQVTII